MTIDELGVVILTTLTDMENRIDKRFDGVDVRFDMVESELETLQAGLTMANQKIDALRDGLNTNDFESATLKGRVENLEVRTFGSIQMA